ncbi:MAG: hypothetical protein ABI723_03240 [Bacteroidia bacterium]
MKISLRILLLLLISCNTLFAQTPETKAKKVKKHYIYFAWGYNKDWFSKSTIHFKSGSASDFPYDFSWIKVKAHDYPGFENIFKGNISIPQYAYRFGYMVNAKKGIGVEYAFDHAKYIVTQEQTFHVNGKINNDYYDEFTNYAKEEMHFEHTNGANFAMLNVFKEKIFYASKNQKFEMAYIVKAGGGVVIPKTDVTLFGERLDNRFHVAGYIFGVEGGVTLNFWRNIFLSPTFKAAYANYDNALTVDNGRAHHYFYAYEAILVAGYKFRF